jgi:hypothetical protein
MADDEAEPAQETVEEVEMSVLDALKDVRVVWCGRTLWFPRCC